MVEAVRRTRAGSLTVDGAARSSGAVGQWCQQRGRSLFAPGRTTTGKERLPQGMAEWQLFAACSGVFAAAGFSRGFGTLSSLPDASAAWFADFARRCELKMENRVLQLPCT